MLRWFAYFEEVVPESAEEQYRIRRFTILYYLEDDTLEVTEPKQENSGILQVTCSVGCWIYMHSL